MLSPGMTEHSIYAGTKGAIVAYTREVASGVNPEGRSRQRHRPGWIFVESHRKTLGDSFDTEAAAKTMPAGFLGPPGTSHAWLSFWPPTNRVILSARLSSATVAKARLCPLRGIFGSDERSNGAPATWQI